jgi:CLASP N terminal
LIANSLVKICGSSKRLLSQIAQNAMRILILHTNWNHKYPATFSYLLTDKNQIIRQAAAECIKLIMERAASDDGISHHVERGEVLEVMEKAIKKSLGDALGAVRELGKDSFHYLQIIAPGKAAKYNSLTLGCSTLLTRQLRKPS